AHGNPWSGFAPAGASNPIIHRHAANSRDPLPLLVDSDAVVCGALLNSDTVPAVGPKRTFLCPFLVVPIVIIALVIQGKPTASRPVGPRGTEPGRIGIAAG